MSSICQEEDIDSMHDITYRITHQLMMLAGILLRKMLKWRLINEKTKQTAQTHYKV